MKFPEWTTPGLWGAVIGAVATMIVGFSYGGWSTAGTSDRVASEKASVAVTAALVPFCVAKAKADTDAAKMTKLKSETSSYSRSDIVRASGWATMPGMTAPDYALASACAERMQTATN
jgi:hypothetical protein